MGELQKFFLTIGRNERTMLLEIFIGDLTVQAQNLEEDWLEASKRPVRSCQAS